MSRYGHNKFCDCGQPATVNTSTGSICKGCRDKEEVQFKNQKLWRWGIVGVPDRAEYDGETKREWRFGNPYIGWWD